MSSLSLSRLAAAQTPELDRARATFVEALSDERTGHVETALEKFRSVAAVRDTAQVEYRIGSCLEALGQRRPAIVAYDKAARLGRGDPQAADVVSSADDRMAVLAAEMGSLGIIVHGSDAAAVSVDGEKVAPDELGAVTLEPGEHVVDVVAPGTKPAHASVTIVRGGKLQLTVDLVHEAPPPPPPPPPPPSHVRQYVGFASMAVGAALAAGAGAVLLVRNDLIDSIHSTCPNDVCPSSSHDQVEGWRSTATTLEVPAAVLGGLAIAALATGVVLVALGPQRRAPTASFVPLDRGGAFFLRGAF